jgi:hypothetical protein
MFELQEFDMDWGTAREEAMPDAWLTFVNQLVSASPNLRHITLRAARAGTWRDVIREGLFREFRTLALHVQTVCAGDVGWMTSKLAGSLEVHIGGGNDLHCIHIRNLQGLVRKLAEVMKAALDDDPQPRRRTISHSVQVIVSGRVLRTNDQALQFADVMDAVNGTPGLTVRIEPDAYFPA